MYTLKPIDINDYTDTQIQTALAADIQTAIALWRAKDWQTYRSICDVLLALLRAGRGDEVGTEQMQFKMFILTHLRSRFSDSMSAWRMFTSDLPADCPEGDEAWVRVSDPSFINQML